MLSSYEVHHQNQWDFDDEVLPGVIYGVADELLSPAYWALRCKTIEEQKRDFVNRYGSLEEEVGFCLLGGYGVTVEVATAFFVRLKNIGVFNPNICIEEPEILNALLEPLPIKGRLQRYRFPKQRSKRLSNAMEFLATTPLDLQDAITFRDDLQKISGIGPKTASWITRNWLNSDDVAIIDIHILRAGWAINLFDKKIRLPRDYFSLEKKFLKLAEAIDVRASILDAVIWSDMRTFGSRLLRRLDVV